MRKVILFVQVSLDGFFEGPKKEIDWHKVDDELHAHVNQELKAMGAFLGSAPGPKPLGLLLYAGAGREQHLDFRLGGHTILVRGLDLGQEWVSIRRQLLGLSQELSLRAELPISA